MYDAHFQRVEQKYLITKEQKEELLKRINNYIEKDIYFESKIHNIYFDTDICELVDRSVSKPIFKDKFRIRSYKRPSVNDEVFLEIKIKYKGVVGKRRTKMKLCDFYHFLKCKKNDSDDQILKEFNYYFRFYNLIPVIFIAYDRLSYRGIDDKSLRITLDTNLRSRRDNLRLEKRARNVNYFEEDMYIMEIKCLNSLPLWLVDTLSHMNIYPRGFSKYGKIYEEEGRKEIFKNVK